MTSETAGSAPKPAGVYGFLVALLYTLTATVMLLRLAVIRGNLEASDDHMQPVELILASRRLPHLADCFQCYHPKLYYLIEAYVFRALHVNDYLTRIQLGAYLDWIAVAVLAVALWTFLRWQELTPLQRAISFALPMSAPGVTIVSVQPSNDGLVTGLSAVAVVAFWRWSGRRTPGWLALAVIAASLAAATKGSGLIIVSGVLAGLAVQRPRFWRTHLGQAALALVLGVAGTLFVLNAGYLDNYRDKGSILASNVGRSPPAPFWPGERRGDAGCNSYAEAYLTFPILSELRVPFVGWSATTDNPPHRSNQWTMMHGNHYYSRFQRWPGTWATTEPFTVEVGRMEITLGLVPLALLVVGLLRRLWSHARLLARFGPLRFVTDRDVWVTSTLVMMLVLLISMSAQYRWAQSMKAFYSYPALVGYTASLACGLELLRRRWLETAAGVVAALLVGLHLLDTGLLAADLQRTIDARSIVYAERTTTMKDGEFDLSGLLLNAKVKSGTALAGTTSAGEAAYCDRAVYDHVIGASSPSEIEFPLNRSWSHFRVKACNAPHAPKWGNGVRFRIKGDGQLLWDSGVVGAEDPVDADVSVVGMRTLVLSVSVLDRTGEDTPLWIDPMLTR